MNEKSLYQDTAFKRIVVGSTGLGLASMIASLAAIRIGPAHGLEFHWHWTILLWMAAAALFNARSWKLVWRMQASPSPELKRLLIIHVAVLFAIGLGAFLYPIRFIAENYRGDIARGLVTAAAFLGTAVWIVIRFGRGFVEQDAAAQKQIH